MLVTKTGSHYPKLTQESQKLYKRHLISRGAYYFHFSLSTVTVKLAKNNTTHIIITPKYMAFFKLFGIQYNLLIKI